MIRHFIVMTMIIAVSLPLKADEGACRKVLKDCDTAVQALQKKSVLDDQIIADEDKRFQVQTKELHDEALWRPFAIGSFTVAVAVTAILLIKH